MTGAWWLFGVTIFVWLLVLVGSLMGRKQRLAEDAELERLRSEGRYGGG